MSRNMPIQIASWLSFAVSLSLYWVTVDPGASYWDCPEYVAVASRMEVGHPPGNPIWMLTMRIATIPFSMEHHALIINLCSGIFMAFSAFFLCRIIYFLFTHLNKRLPGSGYPPYWFSALISFGATLCFSLCDSTWFSAVEAEVYALSTFLSALSLWILTLWWDSDSIGKQTRLLVLLAYITGISLGVHQLNLLLIPVFVLAVYYKQNPQRLNPIKILLLVLLSILCIGFILMAFMPGVLFGAQSFELLSVNTLGLPYNSGVIIFIFLILLLFAIFLALPLKNMVKIGVWTAAFLFLGICSFGMIMIRANAYPPMNEGVPDNIFSLTSYINRDQYPSSPLLYGATPYSQPLFEEKFVEGRPVYNRYILKKEKPLYSPVLQDAILNHRSGMVSHEDSIKNREIIQKGHGYLLSDYKFSQKLTPELDMWLPRITSRKVGDRSAYADWAGMTQDKMDRVLVSETIDSAGNYLPRMYSSGSRPDVFSYRPTYLQNLQFFISYQAYYMYFRYLFWNFIGRQNDFPSTGEIEHGNFITGFPVIDDSLLGNTEEIPNEVWENNPGRNRYFAIPFILGIIGIFWLGFHSRQSRRTLTLTSLLFLMTGLAIVAYLNQSPGEPRERDYTFLVSYMAFAMWIGAGLFGLWKFCRKFMPEKPTFILVGFIALGTPALMAVENFNDHNRSGRYEPTFFASSLWDFELPSIIFSHGDNSTFPLWYISDVLDTVKSHTIVDVTYLSVPSYVANLKKQGKRDIKTMATTGDIAFGGYLLTHIPPDSLSSPMPLDSALQIMYDSRNPSPAWPSSKVIIPSSPEDSVIINLHDLSRGSSLLSFRYLMLLDIMAAQLKADNPKPLFFPYAIDHSFHKAIEPALRPALFGKIYAPWLSDKQSDSLLSISVRRELTKLASLPTSEHYIDPIISDRTGRYRGEMLIAATDLIQKGDSNLAKEIFETLLKVYPFEKVAPSNFTIADTTFYEGKAALDIFEILGGYEQEYLALDSIMRDRRGKWLRYYNSLNPEQRSTLSNKSRRLLIFI